MKIKNTIEMIVFIYLAYIFLPKFNNILSYILKFTIYIIILFIIIYYLDKVLDKFFEYIKLNYINWYRKYHESKHNTKKDLLSYGIIKKIIILIYLSLTNRRKYVSYSKYFIINNKLATLFILIFIILTFSIIYVLIL